MFRAPAPIDTAADRVVAINTRSQTRLLRVHEIRLIAACENYSEVTFTDGHRLLVRRTLQRWIAQLPVGQFYRLHRGLILNLELVREVERVSAQPTRVRLAGNAPAVLEVKRRHWPALRREIDRWRLAQAARPFAVDAKSVAVLPFANFNRDSAGEIFCDGITEELINVLAKIPGLHVAARTSSFHFKNQSLPVTQVARQLGVAYLVEGSVRRNRERVRITAQLIAGATGNHVWSETFDRDIADIFVTQDEIAGLIAQTLELRLRDAARTAPVDALTHRLTLEGRHYWNLRTPDGFARAEVALTQAIARAPDFAPAHAAFADLAVVRAMYRLADGATDVSDDFARVHLAAGRALALDPTRGEAEAALGFACFHAGRFDEASNHFARAFTTNPNYATGHQFHAWALAGQGRLEEALLVYERALVLDPLNFINLDRHAAMLTLAGRHADALEANERAAALRPDIFVGNLSQRAPILLALGRTEEAVAAARAVRSAISAEAFRRNADSDAIFVLAQTGHRAEADDYAATVLERLPKENYLRGFVFAALGRHEDAWDALALTPSIMLPQLYWSRLWSGVRGSNAFARLIAVLGRTNEYRLASTIARPPR
jgi:TolB-like protein/Tfp pilus assembly protein PilF